MTVREVHYPSVGSTSDAAQEIAARAWLCLAGDGASEPVLVWADEQTAGRGRQGRAWASPRGGVYLSVAYPWRRSARSHAGVVPLATGLAVRDALLHLCDREADRLTIKWPNDVLLDGRKVAGVLCERRVLGAKLDGDEDAGGVDLLVVGIGINRTADPEVLGACRMPATSLRASGFEPPSAAACVRAVATRLVERLDRLLQHGWCETDRDALNACLAWRQESVSYEHGNTSRRGILLGTDGEGALRVEPIPDSANATATPAVLTLTSGEISRLQTDPTPSVPPTPLPTL
ncbi:MAG: biotin--[acetyl-CoA-carboxylase] ligase [Planctomycetota bacterium]